MKNLFYSIGIASFLVCMIFTVATSVTNPFYGMSDAAVAQVTTSTTTSQSTSSGTTTFVYVFETMRFKVYDVDEYTKTASTRHDSYDIGGNTSGGYKGILDVGINYNKNSGFKSETSSKTFNNATVCKDGGYSECYKSPKGPTLFEWN